MQSLMKNLPLPILSPFGEIFPLNTAPLNPSYFSLKYVFQIMLMQKGKSEYVSTTNCYGTEWCHSQRFIYLDHSPLFEKLTPLGAHGVCLFEKGKNSLSNEFAQLVKRPLNFWRRATSIHPNPTTLMPIDNPRAWRWNSRHSSQ